MKQIIGIFLIVFIVACEGPTGPQGETGPMGPQGEQGETGAVGPQGDSFTDNTITDDIDRLDSRIDSLLTALKPSSITIASVDRQSAVTGSEITDLVVAVTDSKGIPLSARIDLEVVSGDAVLSVSSIITESDGIGKFGVVLGDTPGEISIVAQLYGSTAYVTLTIISELPEPSELSVICMACRSVSYGDEFSLTVQIFDQGRRGLQGIDIVAAITGGSAQLSSSKYLTDIDGLVTIRGEGTSTLGEAVVEISVANTNLLAEVVVNTEPKKIRYDFVISGPDDILELQQLGGPHYELAGSLFIGGATFPALSGLAGLRSLGGDLVITLNPELINLSGIDSLRYIGGSLSIESNSSLQSLDGIKALQFVGGYVSITDNPTLSNIDGLSLLKSIGTLIPDRAFIWFLRNENLSKDPIRLFIRRMETLGFKGSSSVL